MACFLLSVAEAAAVAAAEKALEKKEEGSKSANAEEFSVPVSTKLKWLRNMLMG